jgi:catechol-2,3-dioxygenase
MFSNPDLAHRAFKVGSLAALKRFYQKIVERGIPIKSELLHGISIAFYFHDPEGNVIEVYWPTGLERPQPCVQQVDLTKPEAELLEELKVLTGRKDFPSPTDQKV